MPLPVEHNSRFRGVSQRDAYVSADFTYPVGLRWQVAPSLRSFPAARVKSFGDKIHPDTAQNPKRSFESIF